MARRRRVFDDPMTVWHLINRTLLAMFMLTPTDEVNRIILGCLARAARHHRVELFIFNFMSNHFHIMARASQLQLSAFMQLFESLLAVALNHHWGRHGTVFPEPFRAIPLLDQESIERCYQYIANNPCAADLVTRCHHWKGVNSHAMRMAGVPIVGQWSNRPRLKRLCRQRGLLVSEATEELEALAIDSHEVELSPLPGHEHLGAQQQLEALGALVEAGAQEHDRRRGSKGVVGMERVRGQRHTDSPEQPARKRPALCQSACPRRRARYIEHLRSVWRAYDLAATRWRQGHLDVAFPPGTFPPGRSRPVPLPERGPTRPEAHPLSREEGRSP